MCPLPPVTAPIASLVSAYHSCPGECKGMKTETQFLPSGILLRRINRADRTSAACTIDQQQCASILAMPNAVGLWPGSIFLVSIVISIACTHAWELFPSASLADILVGRDVATLLVQSARSLPVSTVICPPRSMATINRMPPISISFFCHLT
ncbi:unnamed protein product [Periconia digitata]|uniref:Uncharacterized protein n=1 Tax=Periconia digitata TaxID=1303443 RepID=A0A9W4UUL8_9PLEO|nr:unnamed protein product [Periconia digitata]